MMSEDFIVVLTDDQENIEVLDIKPESLDNQDTIQMPENEQQTSSEESSSSNSKGTIQEDDICLEITRLLQQGPSTAITSSETTDATCTTMQQYIQVENASFIYNIQEYVEIESDPTTSPEYNTDIQEEYIQNTSTQFEDEEYIDVNNSAEAPNNEEDIDDMEVQYLNQDECLDVDTAEAEYNGVDNMESQSINEETTEENTEESTESLFISQEFMQVENTHALTNMYEEYIEENNSNYNYNHNGHIWYPDYVTGTENEESEYTVSSLTDSSEKDNEMSVSQEVVSDSPVSDQQQKHPTKEDFLNFITIALENTEYGRELLKYDGRPPYEPAYEPELPKQTKIKQISKSTKTTGKMKFPIQVDNRNISSFKQNGKRNGITGLNRRRTEGYNSLKCYCDYCIRYAK